MNAMVKYLAPDAWATLVIVSLVQASKYGA